MKRLNKKTVFKFIFGLSFILTSQWSVAQNTPFSSTTSSDEVVIGNNEMTFSPDQNAKLHVDGKAVFREAVVRPTGWSDFVFDGNYKLLPLEDVKVFIQENKHLPDALSEKKVKEEGVSVVEMDAILLQKN